ncbi:ABC transporter ATP-binding protein, partial [Streptococcus mutans]|nr:ABC transporter ATP-binding protein [Streptococcus mutans]
LTVLESFLQDFSGPVITVSHDRYFLDKVANKILAFEHNAIRENMIMFTTMLREVKHLNIYKKGVSRLLLNSIKVKIF